MESDLKTQTVERFFAGTGRQYDRIAGLCTFGFDRRWKKRILREIPEKPYNVIDQACGTGILTFEIARRFPHCHIVGVELRDEYLDIARERALALGFRNIEFILGRAEDVLLEEGFDCITSSYLAKYAEIEPLVKNARKMLRAGGSLIVHDFTYPRGRISLFAWKIYFLILQTVGSLIYPRWKTIFDDLPVLLRHTRWVEQLINALENNGFSQIEVSFFTLGTSAIVTAKKDRS